MRCDREGEEMEKMWEKRKRKRKTRGSATTTQQNEVKQRHHQENLNHQNQEHQNNQKNIILFLYTQHNNKLTIANQERKTRNRTQGWLRQAGQNHRQNIPGIMEEDKEGP